MTLQPCIECGELAQRNRCETHKLKQPDYKPDATRRGYDYAWEKLSRKARKLQPFCSDCGATSDLQADHSPQAWERHGQGKPIRLQDIDVVCGPCNRKRGNQRPGGKPRLDDPQNPGREGMISVSKGFNYFGGVL